MWALRSESLELLDKRLEELKPRLCVEAGSGKSTAVLSRHARTISLEHLPRYAAESRLLAPEAEIRLAPLKDFHTLAGTFRWYDSDLPSGIDFALIDGPPGLSEGREAALFALWPYLSKSWEIWLDDADRQHEKECLNLWGKFFRFRVERLSKSLARLTPRVTELPLLAVSGDPER
jgi:hypothetical protein